MIAIKLTGFNCVKNQVLKLFVLTATTPKNCCSVTEEFLPQIVYSEILNASWVEVGDGSVVEEWERSAGGQNTA